MRVHDLTNLPLSANITAVRGDVAVTTTLIYKVVAQSITITKEGQIGTNTSDCVVIGSVQDGIRRATPDTQLASQSNATAVVVSSMQELDTYLNTNTYCNKISIASKEYLFASIRSGTKNLQILISGDTGAMYRIVDSANSTNLTTRDWKSVVGTISELQQLPTGQFNMLQLPMVPLSRMPKMPTTNSYNLASVLTDTTKVLVFGDNTLYTKTVSVPRSVGNLNWTAKTMALSNSSYKDSVYFLN